MRPVKSCPLSHLRFLIQKGRIDHVRHILYSPDFLLIDDPPSNAESADVFHAAEEVDFILSDFIRLHLLTGCFLHPEKHHEKHHQWLKDHVPVERFFPGMDYDLLVNVRWCAVPIAVVSAERSRIYHLICGFHPTAALALLPSWACHLLDSEAHDAIKSAAEAAKKLSKTAAPGLIVYPLLPDRGEVQITGSSLGLPLALGFYSLIKREPIDSRLAMTGAITPDGTITKVGSLNKKIDLFQQKKFTAVLYPAANKWTPKKSYQDCFPVSDLKQAVVFCDLYAPEKAENLQLFWQMLNNAQAFVNNADIVRPEWLKHAHKNKWAQKTIDAILKNPVLFLQLSEKLAACGDKFQLDQGNALSRFISPKALPKTLEVAPLAAFKWCTANLALANHQGDVINSGKWVESAELFRTKALAANINEVATFYNHYLVSRHNLYAFKPIIPPALKKTLQCLEAQYKARCKAGNKVFIILGRLYGTLVQNYAFCGPSYLGQVDAYSQQARQCLGENTVPEFKIDWMRQYSYLTYALVSAGKMKRAQTALFKYCEISGWDQLPSKINDFSPWQHALLARFLAESNKVDICRFYLQSRAASEPKKSSTDHPWQLWYWNMGRIAFLLKEDDLAGSLMKESLRRCRALKKQPTITVMALMPLSFLHYYKMIGSSEIKKTEEQVQKAAGYIDRKHFASLHHKKFTVVLEQVRQHLGKLFPFSYR